MRPVKNSQKTPSTALCILYTKNLFENISEGNEKDTNMTDHPNINSWIGEWLMNEENTIQNVKQEHWEGDTVVGIRWWSKQVILTNVERKTGYLLAEKLKRRTGECVLEATKEFFKKLPKYKRKSITYDNWREFSEHRMIEYSTKLRVFFAHPYSSWERGTNENTNWLLRQFVPKKTDFIHVTNKALKTYVHLINHRPRERLNFLTPHEVFMEWKSCIWL